jgi:hypothetical protein
VTSLETGTGLCNDMSSGKPEHFLVLRLLVNAGREEFWSKWEVAPYLALLATLVAGIQLRQDCDACGRPTIGLRHLRIVKSVLAPLSLRDAWEGVKIWHGKMKVRFNSDMPQSGTVLQSEARNFGEMGTSSAASDPFMVSVGLTTHARIWTSLNVFRDLCEEIPK